MPSSSAKTSSEGAALLAARLLRRGRARHRIGGTGAGRSTARRSTSVTRSCITATWSTACGPKARFSSRNSAKFPNDHAPVIFSAHGVARAIPEEARRRNLFTIDATCPLVTKVHREAEIHNRRGREIVLIGHAGHPEVVGTMGQLPPGSITLVETLEDVEKFTPRDANKLAYVTQTTLSVDDTAAMVDLLKQRFPDISGPHKEDICYATTNRQDAVKRVAPIVDAMIVVGAPNSSNSQRLKEVAEKSGCPRAVLMQRAADINWSDFDGVDRLGITAGASAPEVLVEEIMGAFADRYILDIETVTATEEGVFFPLPRPLRDHEAAE